MLTTIILLSFVAAAFWKETIKLAVAAVIVVLLLGVVQLVQLADQAGIAPAGAGEISSGR